MNKNSILKNLFFLAALIIALPFSAESKEAKNQIIDLTTIDKNQDLRLTFEVTDFPKYRVFTTSKPEKLVIDFQDSEIKSRLDFSKSKSFKSIKITTNSHSDLRIIIYLNQNVQVSKSNIIKPFGDKKYLLEIYLKFDDQPVQKNNFSKVKYTLVTPLNSKIADKIMGDDDDAKPAAKNVKIKAKPIIVIDAGHGGKDPGTIGDYARSKEKNVTLAYAKELKRYLDKTGKYKAFLTRDNDYFIPLNQRVEKSRKLKADLFISIHADSSNDDETTGLSIYTLSEKSSDKQAEILAQKENKSDIIGGVNFSGTSGEIMNTLINLSQRDSMNSSAKFAEIAIKTLHNEDIEILQNTHRFAGFRVLTAPDVAAVLIELGYLSNKHEERQLNDVFHRRKVAQVLVESIDRYFGKIN
jgi:N-acetylmuramoyl-L-alanine amidase